VPPIITRRTGCLQSQCKALERNEEGLARAPHSTQRTKEVEADKEENANLGLLDQTPHVSFTLGSVEPPPRPQGTAGTNRSPR